jgi:hypothetical protein
MLKRADCMIVKTLNWEMRHGSTNWNKDECWI